MGDAEPQYHVECRERNTEELATSERAARRVAADHESTADPRVDVGRIDD